MVKIEIAKIYHEYEFVDTFTVGESAIFLRRRLTFERRNYAVR